MNPIMQAEVPVQKPADQNPVVFITGSGRRMGSALALGFAKRGWNVAVHYGSSRSGAEDTVRRAGQLGVTAAAFGADVKDPQAIAEAVEQAARHFGRLDALVNNAAMYPAATPLEQITPQAWNAVIDTNLSGYFFAAQAAAEIMRSQPGRGSIVNIASLGAFQIWKNRIPYHVSKAGVVQLTRALARELAPHITVNAVAPGAIAVGEDPQADAQLIAPAKIPMARHGTPDDIFNAIWFLITQAPYITGQTLIVDGGLGL